MGSSSSRHRPRPQQQQTPGGGGGMNNGQFYGGYAAQQPQAQFGGGAQQPPAPAGGARYGYGQPPRPAVAAQEYTQTATVKNQVNLKKWTLKVTPLPGRPHEFGLSFSFDATAPCRVTTYLLATEDPKDGCRLVSAVLGAPVRTPVVYEKGGDEEVAEAHVISSLRAPLGHMMLAAGDSYPLIIRLESMTDEGREQGHSLDELEVGGAFAPWSQAQTTYAKLKQDEAGAWQVAVLKQKIWVKGVSYQLQEIYGLEAATKRGPAAARRT
ncbi:hypothetical protein Rsub_04148 [Raphidocelis subcapitata]|uniref:RING-type E3 ubiquitin transferase n=1 Tax=Raphidocelis subcapitata TaxID=307507 RepID=A0A2V0NUT9_9CHLO|nr:hypothetical protein Rsub_04148 [Raphidocelis subcapitata]|eukprot:GBF91408.1 hypothetical protein Rsub_04148 [Raphidocelis subcapitata]